MIDNEPTPAEENARALANSFARERVKAVVDQLESLLSVESGSMTWSKERVDRVLGTIVSTAYFKGYMDRHNGEKIKHLII